MYGSFKGLLLMIGLQHRFNAMSHLGMFPEGMKASEAKRAVEVLSSDELNIASYRLVNTSAV